MTDEQVLARLMELERKVVLLEARVEQMERQVQELTRHEAIRRGKV